MRLPVGYWFVAPTDPTARVTMKTEDSNTDRDNRRIVHPSSKHRPGRLLAPIGRPGLARSFDPTTGPSL
jgi:hypothetical protein